MDKTKYLKLLQKEGKLSDLLQTLSLPSHDSSGFRYGCKLTMSETCLTIQHWNHDYSSSEDYDDAEYKLNDYTFISGIYDPEQAKLQKLFDFMSSHFPTYKQDAKLYLEELRQKETAKIDAEHNRKKTALNAKIDATIKKLK